MNYIRSRLGLKLFLSYIGVIFVGVVVIGIAVRFTTPQAFARHMMPFRGQFGMGPMMGQNWSNLNDGLAPDLFESFQASFNESLIWAIIAAACVAVFVSILFSRSIIAPLRAIMSASQRIASGHYEERVNSQGTDEIGQLAQRFNQMAEQLEQVEAMRCRLIGDVAHELRTPLAAIQGSVEGLVDGVLPGNAETYDLIHTETERLGRLVDDLQELSRVEARAYELDLRPLEISTLIEIVCKRIRQRFDQKSVALKTDLPEVPTLIIADEDRVIQVLSNLVDNALRYTQEKGQVLITAKQTGREVLISVDDTGVGIPRKHLPLIFDRFYRVDAARSRSGGGSGIGLTIAKHLVEAQGGRIWAVSEGEGKGSSFRFILPAG